MTFSVSVVVILYTVQSSSVIQSGKKITTNLLYIMFGLVGTGARKISIWIHYLDACLILWLNWEITFIFFKKEEIYGFVWCHQRIKETNSQDIYIYIKLNSGLCLFKATWLLKELNNKAVFLKRDCLAQPEFSDCKFCAWKCAKEPYINVKH